MTSNQIFVAIRPLLKLNQILGFCTFSSLYKHRNMKLKCVYPVLLTGIYLAMTAWCIYFTINSMYTPKRKFINTICYGIAALYLVVIWSSGIVCRNRHIQLIKEILKYDKMYRAMFHDITDYRKIRGLIKKHILLAFVSLFIVMLIVIDLVFCEQFRLAQIVAVTVLNSPLQIGFFINPILLAYVHIIEERLDVLNRKILELNHAKKINISVVKNIEIKRELTMLRSISLLHHHLSEQIRLLCETFGIVLLAWFGLTLKHVVFTINYINNVNVGNVTTTLAFLQGILVMAPVAFICHSCHNTTIKFNIMALLIHDIETDNPHLTEDIEMFLLQLANEKVEFNAAGFFPINYQLLFSMIGGAVTYIIILKQL